MLVSSKVINPTFHIIFVNLQLPPHLQGLLPRWPLLPPSALPGLNPALFKSGKFQKRNLDWTKYSYLVFHLYLYLLNPRGFTMSSLTRKCPKPSLSKSGFEISQNLTRKWTQNNSSLITRLPFAWRWTVEPAKNKSANNCQSAIKARGPRLNLILVLFCICICICCNIYFTFVFVFALVFVFTFEFVFVSVFAKVQLQHAACDPNWSLLVLSLFCRCVCICHCICILGHSNLYLH